jgi:transposase
LLDQIRLLTERIDKLTIQVRKVVQDNEIAQRLSTIPGVGPITAMTLATLAPPTETFRKGRDFAARAGLTPRQH